MGKELLACPFCGSSATLEKQDYGVTIYCNNCPAIIEVCDSEENAVELWNNRYVINQSNRDCDA